MSSNESHENRKVCFNELPGDPSLLLVTNVDLGDKKLEVMKGKFRYNWIMEIFRNSVIVKIGTIFHVNL